MTERTEDPQLVACASMLRLLEAIGQSQEARQRYRLSGQLMAQATALRQLTREASRQRSRKGP